MSVTPDVSHVEMWPYVASAPALSESHAETAVRMVISLIVPPHQSAAELPTPHDVDLHGVESNA